MYSVQPAMGVPTMMMDQTPEGQELLRIQSISAWDMICEWFEHPKIRIALARYASESMLNPFDNGTGFGSYPWIDPPAVRLGVIYGGARAGTLLAPDGSLLEVFAHDVQGLSGR